MEEQTVERAERLVFTKPKLEVLRDKVIEMVLEFIKTEGDITFQDLKILFGIGEVRRALDKMPITLK